MLYQISSLSLVVLLGSIAFADDTNDYVQIRYQGPSLSQPQTQTEAECKISQAEIQATLQNPSRSSRLDRWVCRRFRNAQELVASDLIQMSQSKGSLSLCYSGNDLDSLTDTLTAWLNFTRTVGDEPTEIISVDSKRNKVIYTLQSRSSNVATPLEIQLGCHD